MEPGILIGIFAVIFLVTGHYIWRRDVLFGFVYLFLFIYSIFAQIGYAYFPVVSELINAYFGPQVFYSVNIFVTLSFISFFIVFYFLHKYVIKRPAYKVVQSHQRLSIIFYMVVIGHMIGMALYFYLNYDLLTYTNAYDEEFQASQGLPFILFGIGFKLSVAVNLALYFMLRVKTQDAPRINRTFVLVLFLLELTLFIVISFRLGSRTDPLSLMLAVTALEIGLMRGEKTNSRNLLKLAAVYGVVLFTLVMIEAARSQGGAETGSLAERILYRDYYPPFHILIAAMALHYVDTLEVIASNSANALVLLKHPYIQETVTELFNPGISTRSSSYAFYLFGEGYIAAGWIGFIYNGLVVFLGVSLWRRLAHSNHRYYNLFMLSLVATQMANIVRSQSSYFIKDIYMIFLPAMILFFLGTGLRPWLGRGFQWDLSAIDSRPPSHQ
ncbi:MAG: hypothetical protein ACYDC8_12350 [Gammaproteobacteria bacterium]